MGGIALEEFLKDSGFRYFQDDHGEKFKFVDGDLSVAVEGACRKIGPHFKQFLAFRALLREALLFSHGS